ncbi:MAG: tRNA (N(6)-L-threonylcarbamoyladenosine(37)-C(2))-methylthiotransferase MtaB [Prevotella sp.]|nr:tRNA (N(6)-L-threonylcarbamoyladenosine(37)-C(2))-methylthiotransferase MtaB [Prevotella sp.]
MKAAFFTLGCKLNFAETSAIGRALAEHGVERAAEGEIPDIAVVNTCSVTAMADKKCRQLINRLHRQWPSASIVVTGCYAQLQPSEVAALPGVSVVLGSGQKLRAVQYAEQWLRSHGPEENSANVAVEVAARPESLGFEPSCERGDRTRWFLKVQDGCDRFCTYCTIPYARGRSRSPRIADIVSQAREAASRGAKEIILTGVNIGDFGRRNANGGEGYGETFFDLARRLDEVEGIERYRISSIEPDLLDPQLIEWVAKESRAFMPHFHIPLQSGSDAVLRLMARRYDTALFADRIAAIKELMPDAFIGVDVIAGARGETEREWEASRRFIEELPVTRLHVFPYSERPGTSALRLSDAVDQATKHRRVEVLTQLSARKLNEFIQGSLGQVRPVLWETERHGVMSGLTDNYLRVEMPGAEALHNTITNVKLVRGDGETVYGEGV